MMYLGGKSRIAKAIAAYVAKYQQGKALLDPFCGGLTTATAFSLNGPVVASDSSVPLIALYNAVARGWEPPTDLTERQYQAAKGLLDTDPLKAFAGFGCSFGGKWFGGFARGKCNYALATHNAVIRQVNTITAAGGWFSCRSFFEVPVDSSVVLYLDPPYAGTTPYKGVAPFDTAAFWDRVKLWSVQTDVFVSEYNGPGEPVLAMKSAATLGGGTQGKATEKLWHFGPRGKAFP